jgi:hypothetical protein
LRNEHKLTFKELQKVIQSHLGPEQSQLLQRLRDKPFGILSEKEHKEKEPNSFSSSILLISIQLKNLYLFFYHHLVITFLK